MASDRFFLERLPALINPNLVLGDEDVVTVSPHTSAKEAAAQLIEARRHSMVVVDDDSCPIGRILADDVLDAVRAGKFSVISISPILQNTRPILESIRFQAEGEGDDLVKTLRGALDAIARHHTTTSPDE